MCQLALCTNKVKGAVCIDPEGWYEDLEPLKHETAEESLHIGQYYVYKTVHVSRKAV